MPSVRLRVAITLLLVLVTTINQSSTVSAASTSTILFLSLSTDMQLYQPGSIVNLQGYVTDGGGSALADARVSIQVDSPTGSEIAFFNNLRTDSAGVFMLSFRLQANATAGTYTTFATATVSGYASISTHLTFVVNSTMTPSVAIKEVYLTDIIGVRSAVFSAGQTILVWVILQNSGTPFQCVVWVQITDSTASPVSIQLQTSTLSSRETARLTFGFNAQANMTLGLHTATALVSDKLISQGGVFLSSAQTQFALTG